MRALLPALALLSCASLACDETHGPDELTRVVGSDYFCVGSRVELTRPAQGSVIIAGGDVAIRARAPGDVLIAGGTLELDGPFEADVYAVGGRIRLDGKVTGAARMAGGEVQLGSNTDIGEGVSIAAGEANLRGSLHNYLLVAAERTHLHATIAGDVDVSGSSLDIGPDATIQGSLTFRGPQAPEISPGARVLGEVRHIATAPAPFWQQARPSLGWALAMALIGTLCFAFLPRLSRAIVQIAGEETSSALLLGSCLLFGVPVAALIALFTILGAPLAVAALALYALSLPLGYVVAGMALSERLFRRWTAAAQPGTAQRLFSLALVMVLVGVLCSIPVLGWVLTVLLLSVGMGSMALHGWRWYRGRDPGKPAPLAPDGIPASPAEQPSATP